MSPTMRANVLQEILIDGQTAGSGTPSVDISDIHGMFNWFSTIEKQIILREENRTIDWEEISTSLSLFLHRKNKIEKQH